MDARESLSLATRLTNATGRHCYARLKVSDPMQWEVVVETLEEDRIFIFESDAISWLHGWQDGLRYMSLVAWGR